MTTPSESAVREPTEGRTSWNRWSTSTAPPLKPREFGRWVWRQLTSMRTALILLFLLAIAAIPGSLIPQQRVDPVSRRGLPETAPVAHTAIRADRHVQRLQLGVVQRDLPALGDLAARLHHPEDPRLRDGAAYDSWLSSASRPSEVDRARELLKRQRRRIEVYETADETVVSAEKGYLREAGNLLFHCAVVAVLVGFAVTSAFGFRGSAAVVAGAGFSNTVPQYDQFTPGSRFDTASLAPFSFAVDAFHVTYQESGVGTGTPLSFDAALSVTVTPGAAPYSYDLRVNHPLQIGGTSVFLVGHGFAPNVTVRDGQGNIAHSGAGVFLPLDSSFTSFGVIKAPDAKPTQLGFEGYFFPTAAMTSQGQPYSSFPGAKNPVLVLTGYTGDLGLDTGVPQSVYVLDKTKLSALTTTDGQPHVFLLRMGQTVKLPDGAGSITFNGLKPWVQLQVSQEPGKIIPLVGVLSAITGLLFSLFIRPRRTWIRIRDTDRGTAIEAAALDRVPGGDPATHIADVAAALRPKPPTGQQ